MSTNKISLFWYCDWFLSAAMTRKRDFETELFFTHWPYSSLIHFNSIQTKVKLDNTPQGKVKTFYKTSITSVMPEGEKKNLGGPEVIGGDNLSSPSWNRVYWAGKYWRGGGQWPLGSPSPLPAQVSLCPRDKSIFGQIFLILESL